MAPPDRGEKKVLIANRRARHDYELGEILEAGVSLLGSEVKSLRDSQGSLVDAYAELRGGEVWLVNAQINPYPWANQFNHEPRRERRLLLHKSEIRRLARATRERGLTLIPLELYLTKGKVKVALALARGKRQHEKREKKRLEEAQREMERGKD